MKYTFGSALIDEEILFRELSYLGKCEISFDDVLQRVEVEFDHALTTAEHDQLTASISNHNPALERAKITASAAIDQRTMELIDEGVVFDGSTFSLSVAAQANWIGMKQALDAGIISLPYTVTSFEGEYVFTDYAEYITFYATGLGAIGYHTGTGRALKIAILAAVDVAAVSAITDDR